MVLYQPIAAIAHSISLEALASGVLLLRDQPADAGATLDRPLDFGGMCNGESSSVTHRTNSGGNNT